MMERGRPRPQPTQGAAETAAVPVYQAGKPDVLVPQPFQAEIGFGIRLESLMY
jgi:hypothetical protein